MMVLQKDGLTKSGTRRGKVGGMSRWSVAASAARTGIIPKQVLYLLASSRDNVNPPACNSPPNANSPKGKQSLKATRSEGQGQGSGFGGEYRVKGYLAH